jgi:hypothetical protein
MKLPPVISPPKFGLLAGFCAILILLAPTSSEICRGQSPARIGYGAEAIAPQPSPPPAVSFTPNDPAASPAVASPPSFAQGNPASQSVGCERFVLVVFTSQSTPKLPKHSHTWASLVRIAAVFDPNTGASRPEIVCVATISWMPQSLAIKPFVYCVEPGMNMNLEETIEVVLSDGRERITVWGPFEATPELAARFMKQKAFLESGAIGYQCVDALGEAAIRRNGTNCIHAVTPIHGYAMVDFFQSYGDASGAGISAALLHRKLAFANSPVDDWLLNAIGLHGVPYVCRQPNVAGIHGQ